MSAEKIHQCKTLKNIDSVFIKILQTEHGLGWFWCFVENKDSHKEKTDCHEIQFCPYCGEKLEIGVCNYK